MIITASFRKLIHKLCLTQVRLYADRPKTRIRVLRHPMKLGELETMKLEGDLFNNLLTPETKIIEELFKKNGFEIRIAGGAVRDLLMGIAPHDLDFASTATPMQMKEMFTSEGIRMINAGGERHGTITARINDKANFEITTLRIDKVTDGRHAEVEFTTDWQIDANRRDLTVNAMFLSFDGTVYDYFKGREHLEQRKILFVGDAASRIQEDYLRILRYFRFYGRLAVDANHHDAATLEAIRQNCDGLEIIAGERLYTELEKIAVGGFHCSLVCLMVELGVLQHLGFPQKPDLEEFKAVCDRSRGQQLHAMTRLAALCRTEEEAMAVHARLRLSNANKCVLLYVVRLRHLLEDGGDDEKLRTLQGLIFSREFKGLQAQETAKITQEILKYKGESELLSQFEKWEIPKFPVGGFQLASRGVRKGPEMGFVLDRLREVWVDSDFSLSSEELLDKVGGIIQERTSKQSPR